MQVRLGDFRVYGNSFRLESDNSPTFAPRAPIDFGPRGFYFVPLRLSGTAAGYPRSRGVDGGPGHALSVRPGDIVVVLGVDRRDAVPGRAARLVVAAPDGPFGR